MGRRHKHSEILRTDSGRRHFATVVYPEIPPTEDDIYVITAGGDRFDTLSMDYYGDSTLWWIISSANPSNTFSLAIKPGTQIRIPADPIRCIERFEDFNRQR